AATEKAYSEIPVLALGKSIDQEVSGGESYAYKITLGGGEYLRVLIAHSGLQMGMTLYAPNGPKLSEIVCRQAGPTPLSVIAKVSGIYRLELRLLEKDPIPGHYRVTVEEIRPTTAQDIHRIAAERAFAKAEELRNEWKAESSRKAIESYEEALQHWRTAGEGLEETVSLRNIGEVYQLLGVPGTALNFYQQALVVSKNTNDPKSETATLNGISDVYLHLGNNQKAMECC